MASLNCFIASLHTRARTNDQIQPRRWILGDCTIQDPIWEANAAACRVSATTPTTVATGDAPSGSTVVTLLPNGRLRGPTCSRQALAHDRHDRRVGAVAVREPTTLQQEESHSRAGKLGVAERASALMSGVVTTRHLAPEPTPIRW